MIALKVFVLILSCGYIIKTLESERMPDIALFFDELISRVRYVPGAVLLFLLLALANWLLEIRKWQLAAGVLDPISFPKAAGQSLISFFVSLSTPNRIGEFGAKAWFFQKKERKKCLLLNLYANATQLSVTLVMGIPALILVWPAMSVSVSKQTIILCSLSLLIIAATGFLFRRRQILISGFTLERVWRYFGTLSITLKGHILALSFFRYLIFSSLFYLLLSFFGASLPLLEALPMIFAMYLIASLVPAFFLFDVVVRGGVSLWLFTQAGVPEMTILCTVLGMWMLNVLFPAFWGALLMMAHKTQHP